MPRQPVPHHYANYSAMQQPPVLASQQQARTMDGYQHRAFNMANPAQQQMPSSADQYKPAAVPAFLAGYQQQQQHFQQHLPPPPPVSNHFAPPEQGVHQGSPAVGKTLDRRQLEYNLGRLIAERGVDAISQLTKEMSPYQIHQLLQLTRSKLDESSAGRRSRRPLDLGAIDDERLESLLTQLGQARMTSEVDHASSSEDESGRRRERRHSTRRQQQSKNVHFDPSQVPAQQPQQHLSPQFQRRRPAYSSGRLQQQQQPQQQQFNYGSLPRSNSYAGRLPDLHYFNQHPHRHQQVLEEDSSSSDDSDDASAYRLPSNRAYGGVRVSYVPNDRARAGRSRSSGRQRRPREAIVDLERASMQQGVVSGVHVVDHGKDKNCRIS